MNATTATPLGAASTQPAPIPIAGAGAGPAASAPTPLPLPGSGGGTAPTAELSLLGVPGRPRVRRHGPARRLREARRPRRRREHRQGPGPRPRRLPVDPSTKEMIVSVVDEAGRLVRMIPPDSVAKMIAAMAAYRGR